MGIPQIVVDMGRMFYHAEKFDQNLANWDISSVKYKEAYLSTPGIGTFYGFEFMFDGVTLSTENYDALLESWSTQEVNQGMYFSGGNSQYSQVSKAARDKLINEYGWNITDGGME